LEQLHKLFICHCCGNVLHSPCTIRKIPFYKQVFIVQGKNQHKLHSAQDTPKKPLCVNVCVCVCGVIHNGSGRECLVGGKGFMSLTTCWSQVSNPMGSNFLQPGMNISRLGLQMLQNMKIYMAPNSGNWQIELQKLALGFI
jgi:hypothetical protein